ncbi:MAG: response regulator transcription factor, partial [Desulfobacterales bacterium]|nr:response regulator transcription factor [Desulfobacterales bacterium]
MRILIAEDDFTSRTVLAGVLKKSGHEVVVTVSGAVAWDVMQQSDAPRLLILDWLMPEMDGLDVIRRVRALQTDRPPYIIMLTIRDEKADIIAGLDAGANDYLAKPFDPGELIARVEVGRRMVEMQDALIESKKALEHQ